MTFSNIAVIVLTVLSFTASGQHKGSIEYLRKSPLVNGYVRLPNPDRIYHGCQLPGIRIYSNSPQVRSVNNGIVTHVSLIDSTLLVIIKDHDSCFTYENLVTTDVKKGDTVKRGQEIGVLKKDDDGKFYVIRWGLYIMSKKSSNGWYEDKLISYLGLLEK